MQKRIPKAAVGIGVAIIILFLVIFGIVSGVKALFSAGQIKNDEEAQKKVDKMLKSINIYEGDPQKASVSFDSNLADELPEITQYPLTVEGNGDVDIEIFATSEKSGSGVDGWINEMAEQFNASNQTLSNGKSISVSIRPMASGMGSDYIISNKYLPDGYTPSNSLYGSLIQANGGEVETVTDKLVGNVAGILLSEDVYDRINKKYGSVDISTVAQATADDVMTMGYTNPQSSATGLNFLVSTLEASDPEDILSDKAVKGFSDFQKNVPYVAYTTLQMRTSAKSGSFDGMVMEYQSYINDEDLKNDYKFIPFGVRHDNPLYAVGKLSEDKKSAIEMFAKFCESDKAQQKAESYGFNRNSDYQPEKTEYTGADLIGAQKLWKKNKDSGKDISAVFVADVSGSMDGEPLNALKKSLINGASYINDNNRIGLVSYSTDVTIELPIDKFDLNHRAYFQGAVENLIASGNTASYDAVMVALNMLIKERENNPNSKLMLFLLSDGYANVGLELDKIKPVLEYYQIPIYTISYGEGADTEELANVSQINEAASINATVDDVIYKIKGLFNAQM